MFTNFHLNNKKILVTGAPSGIGKETAIVIAKMGGSLIITGRDNNRLNEVLLQLEGNDHQMICSDLTDEKQLNQLIDNINTIDGIVHCAAIVKSFPIAYLNQAKIEETFQINLFVIIRLTAALLKLKKLNAYSSIVFMSSISASHPHIGGSMYAASKAALESFSKTVAIEHSSKKIRSNTIAAAMVKTPMYEQAEHLAKESLDKHIQKYPLGVGTTADIANAVVFLLSPASKWITGTTLVMDGGLLLGS